MAEEEKREEKRYVGVKENLAYGFANAGQVFGYNLNSYFSLFFTKVFCIPQQAVSRMILFLGIWDTVNDPIMGGIIDKTRTRYGKLRPYLLIVPIPLAIATVMLFSGPIVMQDVKSTTAKIVYMYISYFVWELLYTLGDVPFWGLSSAISPLPSDRTRAISTARFISSLIGGLSTTLLVLLMDGSENDIISMSLPQVFCLISIISACFIICLFSLAGTQCKERVVQTVKDPSILAGFKVLVKNKPLLMIVVGNVLSTITAISGAFETYYYAEVINLNSLKILITLPGTIFGFATYLLIPKLQKRFDNRQIVFLNGIVRAIVSVIVFLIGMNYYNDFKVVVPLLLVQNLIFSFFNTVNMVIPTEMIADTIDYMEWKTGERNEGVSFSVLTFVSKLTGSVASSICTAILPIIGLTYKSVGSETVTVKGDNTDLYIWAFFTVIPYVLGLVSLIPYFFYDLTGKKLKRIRDDMAVRRVDNAKAVSGGASDE
ncbi:MAG: glycoside-pentoside-hexuronide (GPH):cation symporter [Clostridiales bacterium]|nr:glycoside-pentoside-hexuronide (GPH):cation symporter [Clostridiales bacterium]